MNRNQIIEKAKSLGVEISKYWPSEKILSLIETTQAQPKDRMMRYRKNPVCPACGAHPVVCCLRRRGFAMFRCRQCGHRWNVGQLPPDKSGFLPGRDGNLLFRRF